MAILNNPAQALAMLDSLAGVPDASCRSDNKVSDGRCSCCYPTGGTGRGGRPQYKKCTGYRWTSGPHQGECETRIIEDWENPCGGGVGTGNLSPLNVLDG